MGKKRKLKSSLEKYIYPSPNKAIHLLKSNSSDEIKINIVIKKSNSRDKTKTNIANKNCGSSNKTKINIANKNWLNSNLNETTKLHIANKYKSKNLVQKGK